VVFSLTKCAIWVAIRAAPTIDSVSESLPNCVTNLAKEPLSIGGHSGFARWDKVYIGERYPTIINYNLT